MRLYISFLACLWLALPAIAQKEPMEMDELGKSDLTVKDVLGDVKVVSASRSSHKLTDLPITMYVITHEEIVRNGYITLIDVMKHMSGIRVSKPGNGLDGETFLMRGSIGNFYAKILINSIPIQPSVTGSLAIAEHLPVSEADRIEIIFGPSSALYGIDGLVGVINIITRSTDNEPFAYATLIGGEFGYRYGSFIAGGKANKEANTVKYSLYGNFAQREDLNVRYDTANFGVFRANFLSPIEQQMRDNAPKDFSQHLDTRYLYYRRRGNTFSPVLGKMPQKSYMFGGQVEYRQFMFSFLEMGRETFSSTGFNALAFSYDNPERFYGDVSRRLTASYKTDLGRWNLTANASYLQYRTNPLSSRASAYKRTSGRAFKYMASDDLFFELLCRYTTSKKWEWTLGISQQFSSIMPETNDLEAPFAPSDYRPFGGVSYTPTPLLGDFGYHFISKRSGGEFAQLMHVGRRWTWLLGYRHDLSGITGQTNLSLRIGGLWKVTDRLSLRMFGGTGVKTAPPSFSYSSNAEASSTAGYITYYQVPNRELLPEYLVSSEIGMRYQISSKAYLEVIAVTQTQENRLYNALRFLDVSQYPKAETRQQNPYIYPPTAYKYLNTDAESELNTMQIIYKHKGLLGKWNLNIDASMTFSEGHEDLARIYIGDTTGKTESYRINGFRMMPAFLGQFNMDFTPHKHWFIRLESVATSSWYRRYVPATGTPEENMNPGYFALDVFARYRVSSHIDVYCKVLNMLDAEYGGLEATGLAIDLPYNPQLKRNVMIGLTFRLD